MPVSAGLVIMWGMVSVLQVLKVSHAPIRMGALSYSLASQSHNRISTSHQFSRLSIRITCTPRRLRRSMELKRHGVSNDNSIAAAGCWAKRDKLRQAGSDFYLGTEGSIHQFLRFLTSVLDASLLTELRFFDHSTLPSGPRFKI